MVDVEQLLPASGNLSYIDVLLEARREAWEVSDSLLQSIVQRSRHDQLDVPVQGSYDVVRQVDLPKELPLRFRSPFLTLHVSDADQDGIFVVTDTFSRVYGEGSDPEMAVGDYLDSLLARFLDLEENEGILAPGLREDLANMRRYIVRTQ